MNFSIFANFPNSREMRTQRNAPNRIRTECHSDQSLPLIALSESMDELSLRRGTIPFRRQLPVVSPIASGLNAQGGINAVQKKQTGRTPRTSWNRTKFKYVSFQVNRGGTLLLCYRYKSNWVSYK